MSPRRADNALLRRRAWTPLRNRTAAMIRERRIPTLCMILAVCLAAACSTRNAADHASPPHSDLALETPAASAARPDHPPTPQTLFQALKRPSATPTQGPLSLAGGDTVPPAAASAGLRLLSDAGLDPVLVPAQSDIEFSMQPSGSDKLAYERILVPVDRFSSTLEAITLQELRAVWTGSGTSPSFTTIYPSQDITAELERLLGPSGPAVKPQPPDAVGDAVWSDLMSIGIVPFDALTPRLRSLQLDGLSVVDNELASGDWPLATRAWLHPVTERGNQALTQAAASRPTTNRDRARLTVVSMTGVTAIARNTAAAIEQAGDYAFPAQVVGPGLATADLTTTSNEISFVEGCVADNSLGLMLFCAKPEYFATLELSGIDAVGLTGNHLNDFGYASTLASLDFYDSKGMPIYGGGANAEAGRAPLILEHNGNRLAFIGANQFGPEAYQSNGSGAVSAWAGPDNPGAAFFDRAQMIADIEALKSDVDLVFAEVQHIEFDANGDYSTEPVPAQMDDFRALKDAGADVVTGAQAHAPQAIELRGNGIILYGLGNLYFDQTWSWPTSTGLVAWHAIYEGRLLNTHLSVTVIDPDFQLRWATPQERRDVLDSVYRASGW